MNRKKIFFQILTGVIIALLFLTSNHPTSANSEDNFQTTLKSTYTISTSGSTFVEHSLDIKNLSPEFYITKYGLTINSGQLSEINVVSNGQTLTPNIKKNSAKTEIVVEFPDKIVGQDKSRSISISYQNPDLAHINGRVLELNIPRMSNDGHYDSRQAILITPAQFGLPQRITPANYRYEFDTNNLTIEFDQLSNQGISAIFGKEQVFAVTARYHLNNLNNQGAITQVSLPPDTARQKIKYHLLEPKPVALDTDLDGNWIATYYLPPNQKTEVNFKASVLVSLDDINPNLHSAPQTVHTKAQKYWPSNSPEIQSIASNYSTPQKIYDYSVQTLDYTDQDLSNGAKRMGAKQALDTPSEATCQEFTDLFIALARANNIAARRVTGYAYSQNPRLRPLSLVTDVLHTWPEYYDQNTKQWVPIDPTWEDTTGGVDYFNQFDLNHVAFAINGKSSEMPYPAGAYKLRDQESKDVEVEFKDDIEFSKPSFSLDIEPIKVLSIINLPGFYQLKMTNETGQAWYDLNLQVESPDRSFTVKPANSSFYLLPFQEKSFKLSLYNRKKWLPKNKLVKLTLKTPANEKMKIKGQSKDYEFTLLTVGPISNIEQKFVKLKTGFDEFAVKFSDRVIKLRQRVSESF